MATIDFKLFPKVVLHDHLDGGLRPATLIDLSAKLGLRLPSSHPVELAKTIGDTANSGSLTDYLKAFEWTVPAMQSRESLRQVAFEAVQDYANDGVVLAEIRFAPLLHTQKGLSPQDAIDAVTRGINEAMEESKIPVGLILCGMRHKNEFQRIMDLFKANSHGAVVGLDLAGPEVGYPVRSHLASGRLRGRPLDLPLTVHAGEADGASSIRSAIDCGALRIGHGTRLIDDIAGERVILNLVHRNKVHLELCISSNAHTGAINDIRNHPIRSFMDEGISISLNTDNRLMSSTMPSDEYKLAATSYGLTQNELMRITYDSINASFLPQKAKEIAIQLTHSRLSDIQLR